MILFYELKNTTKTLIGNYYEIQRMTENFHTNRNLFHKQTEKHFNKRNEEYTYIFHQVLWQNVNIEMKLLSETY